MTTTIKSKNKTNIHFLTMEHQQDDTVDNISTNNELWNILRNYMRFIRTTTRSNNNQNVVAVVQAEATEANNDEDDDASMMIRHDNNMNVNVNQAVLNWERRKDIHWSYFELALRSLEEKKLNHHHAHHHCDNHNDFLDVFYAPSNMYTNHHNRNLLNYMHGDTHVLHPLLLLDAPCAIVQSVCRLDPAALKCASFQNVPLHAACEFSPRNVAFILEAYPAAASSSVGKNGYLPIESYLLSGVPFPRDRGIVRKLLDATNPEVLERKNTLEVAIVAITYRLPLHINMHAKAMSSDIHVYWDILDMIINVLTYTYSCKPTRKQKYRSKSRSGRINYPLHSVMENPDYLIQLTNAGILSQFIQRHQYDIIRTDYNGNTPLHLLLKSNTAAHNHSTGYSSTHNSSSVISSRYKSSTTFGTCRQQAIHALTKSDPRVSCIPNSGKKLPMHLAIDRYISWETGLRDIYESGDHRIITSRQIQTRLYPFMSAASNGRRSDLNSVYMLLKGAPELSHGLSY